MEVILLERIEGLGQMGDEVSVKPGFARNFLLPQKKALRATDQNKARFETERVQLEAENLKQRDEAEAVGKKLDGQSVILVRQAGDAGQLYGSVTVRDIAKAVIEAGFTIEKNQVVLEAPIKALGIYSVRVTLHPEVTVSVTANVARSAEEAEVQAKTGAAVVSSLEHDEESAAEEAAAEALVAAEELFDEGAAPSEEDTAEEEQQDDSEAASSDTDAVDEDVSSADSGEEEDSAS